MEQTNRQSQPMNIFGCINRNIVDLSKEVVELRRQVHEIHNALFSAMTPIDVEEAVVDQEEMESEPTVPGAETEECAVGDEA